MATVRRNCLLCLVIIGLTRIVFATDSEEISPNDYISETSDEIDDDFDAHSPILAFRSTYDETTYEGSYVTSLNPNQIAEPSQQAQSTDSPGVDLSISTLGHSSFSPANAQLATSITQTPRSSRFDFTNRPIPLTNQPQITNTQSSNNELYSEASRPTAYTSDREVNNVHESITPTDPFNNAFPRLTMYDSSSLDTSVTDFLTRLPGRPHQRSSITPSFNIHQTEVSTSLSTTEVRITNTSPSLYPRETTEQFNTINLLGTVTDGISRDGELSQEEEFSESVLAGVELSSSLEILESHSSEPHATVTESRQLYVFQISDSRHESVNELRAVDQTLLAEETFILRPTQTTDAETLNTFSEFWNFISQTSEEDVSHVLSPTSVDFVVGRSTHYILASYDTLSNATFESHVFAPTITGVTPPYEESSRDEQGLEIESLSAIISRECHVCSLRPKSQASVSNDDVSVDSALYSSNFRDDLNLASVHFDPSLTSLSLIYSEAATELLNFVHTTVQVLFRSERSNTRPLQTIVSLEQLTDVSPSSYDSPLSPVEHITTTAFNYDTIHTLEVTRTFSHDTLNSLEEVATFSHDTLNILEAVATFSQDTLNTTVTGNSSSHDALSTLHVVYFSHYDTLNTLETAFSSSQDTLDTLGTIHTSSYNTLHDYGTASSSINDTLDVLESSDTSSYNTLHMLETTAVSSHDTLYMLESIVTSSYDTLNTLISNATSSYDILHTLETPTPSSFGMPAASETSSRTLEQSLVSEPGEQSSDVSKYDHPSLYQSGIFSVSLNTGSMALPFTASMIQPDRYTSIATSVLNHLQSDIQPAEVTSFTSVVTTATTTTASYFDHETILPSVERYVNTTFLVSPQSHDSHASSNLTSLQEIYSDSSSQSTELIFLTSTYSSTTANFTITTAPVLKVLSDFAITITFDGDCRQAAQKKYAGLLKAKMLHLFLNISRVEDKNSISVGPVRCNPSLIPVSFRHADKRLVFSHLNYTFSVDGSSKHLRMYSLILNLTGYEEALDSPRRRGNSDITAADITIIATASCVCLIIVVAGIVIFAREIYSKKISNRFSCSPRMPLKTETVALTSIPAHNFDDNDDEMNEERCVEETYCNPFYDQYSTVATEHKTTFPSSENNSPEANRDGKTYVGPKDQDPSQTTKTAVTSSSQSNGTNKQESPGYGLIIGLMGYTKRLERQQQLKEQQKQQFEENSYYAVPLKRPKSSKVKSLYDPEVPPSLADVKNSSPETTIAEDSPLPSPRGIRTLPKAKGVADSNEELLPIRGGHKVNVRNTRSRTAGGVDNPSFSDTTGHVIADSNQVFHF